MRIPDFVQQIRSYHVSSTPLTLKHLRETLLFGIIATISAAGLIAYIPSVAAAIYGGYYDIVIIDTLFYAIILVLLLCRRLSYSQRTLGLIIPLWLLSLYLILRFGIYGAGYLWLFVVPILAGVLLGLRRGMMTLGVIFLSLLLIGAGIDVIGHFDSIFGHQPFATWAVMSGNAMALSTLAMVSASVLIHGMNNVLIQLDRKIEELELTKDATLETVASLAEYRDACTGQHIERTKEYVRFIAEHLSTLEKYRALLTPDYIELLRKSSALHDIGKIGVPDTILLKPGKLTPEEYEQMKLHTVYGKEALLRSERRLGENSFLRLAAEIAFSHQERWNGSGYPSGLEGEAIPLSGRIMAVADVYDALISKRVYKDALSHEEAIDYLESNRGVLFDPEIVAIVVEHEAAFRRLHKPETNPPQKM